MTLLSEIIDFNQNFVEIKAYEKYETTKYPNKRIVILTCMDTRLTELLPRAMNLRNGDAKIIKSAGAVITHPFGGIMRSLILAVYELQADEVFIVGHHDCGMSSLDMDKMIEKMIQRGIDKNEVDKLKYYGVNVNNWLRGFDNVNDNVKKSVDLVRNHPLLDPNVPVHGLVADPHTGQLDIIVDGYEYLSTK